MKIYIIAGETSGDIHGADLIKSIYSENSECEIRAMGGDFMKNAGATIAFDYREMAIMGFVEVIKNLSTIRNNLKSVEQDILNFKPDKIVMIDFPGFNLNLAKRLHSLFSLYYYIAPKAWAWNAKRSHKLAKYFKQVFCILPFELEFFDRYKVPSVYVGNPSKNQVDRYLKQSSNQSPKKPYIALFPGSRKQEVQRILPIMLDAIRRFPEISYKISQAPALDRSIYREFVHDDEDLIQENYKLLNGASAALVTSGTATLETALFSVPQIVCYVGNGLSIRIAKLLVKIKYISLVNLILNRMAIPELIQEECSVKNIHEHLHAIINDMDIREKTKNDYQELRQLIGELNASDEVARYLMS